MGALLLLVTTFIWGTAFLAQKLGADHLGPIAITVLRNVLGGAFLGGCILVRRFRGKGADFPLSRKASVLAGVCCGVPLFAAMAAQQIGIQYTKPGISAFLTTNYVLFVPLLVAIRSRRLPRLVILVCALLALGGTALICLPADATAGFRIGRGETWTLLCAFLFAVQILAVSRFARSCDLLVMSVAQLLTCSVLGAPFLFLPSESAHLTATELASAFLPLVYLGVFSSGIAYTLQNFAQARTAPAVAAIVLSLESVFGALSGWVALGDVLTPLQIAGCAVVFAAVVLSQLVPQRA